MKTNMTRRRLLIMAGAAALALSPLGVRAVTGTGIGSLLRWRGVALGAEAEMLLYPGDPERGNLLLARALSELARLEGIFSLFRPDSAISRLNRDGRLAAPPPELLTVLALSQRIWRESKGAFDPSVQPLWAHLAAGRSDADIRTVLARIGFEHVEFGPQRIAFARPGMALTLNGIAQGYITDRIADLLAEEGLSHSLIMLGETRALGARPDGVPWRIAIEGSDHAAHLDGNALSVSRGGGTLLPGGRNHLLDPHDGASVDPGRSMAVLAPRAILADGLSTALCLLPDAGHAALVAAFPGAGIVRA